MNSPHKVPVTREMFPFDDVIMTTWRSVAQHNTAETRELPNNKRVSEMRVPLAACRETAEGPEQAAKCAIYFWT